MINVEVAKSGNESTAGLIRRFSRRVQEAGVLKRARGLRYYERPLSDELQKERALKANERRKQKEKLAKLGKLPQKTGRRR